MTEANIKKVLDRFEEIFEANVWGKEFYDRLRSAYHAAVKTKKGKEANNVVHDAFRASKIQLLRELWDGKIV